MSLAGDIGQSIFGTYGKYNIPLMKSRWQPTIFPEPPNYCPFKPKGATSVDCNQPNPAQNLVASKWDHYDAMFKLAAQAHQSDCGVDWRVLKAIAIWESKLDATANTPNFNRDGSVASYDRGLMQINSRAHHEYDCTSLLSDAQYNINAGAVAFCDAWNHSGTGGVNIVAHLHEAFARYNGGSNWRVWSAKSYSTKVYSTYIRVINKDKA
jgi:soluble lytic murein transglycosylase-like protein